MVALAEVVRLMSRERFLRGILRSSWLVSEEGSMIVSP